MIAKIIYGVHEKQEIILGNDRKWHSQTNPGLAKVLTCRQSNSYSESSGKPGCWQAYNALEILKALEPKLVFLYGDIDQVALDKERQHVAAYLGIKSPTPPE